MKHIKEKPPRKDSEWRIISWVVLVERMSREWTIEILLLERSSFYSFPNVHSFPWGKVEEGETVEEWAIRECGEESGLEPTRLKLIDCCECRSKWRTFISFIFIAQRTVWELFTFPLPDLKPEHIWWSFKSIQERINHPKVSQPVRELLIRYYWKKHTWKEEWNWLAEEPHRWLTDEE